MSWWFEEYVVSLWFCEERLLNSGLRAWGGGEVLFELLAVGVRGSFHGSVSLFSWCRSTVRRSFSRS